MSISEVRFPAAGSYPSCVCLPNGEFAVARSRDVLTHLGATQPVPGNQPLLFLDMAPNGVYVAGKGNANDEALEWTGAIWRGHGPSIGNFGLIYDAADALHINTGAAGVNGYRFIDETGRFVTGDETYRPWTPTDPKLWEWTRRGTIVVGQGGKGPHGEDPCVAFIEGVYRLIEPGQCRQIKFKGTDRLALAFVREDTGEAVLRWLTPADLMALPAYTPPGDGPIVVPDPPPQPNPTPEPDPMPSVPNLKHVIERVRPSYPTPLGARHASFLAVVVQALKAEVPSLNFGLLRKSGGTFIRMPSGTTVSQDIVTVHHGTELWTYDILGSAEAEATPTWNRTKPTGVEKDVSRFYQVKADDLPGQPPSEPDPGEPPVPPTPPAKLPRFIALKTAHGKYLCIEPDGRIVADRDSPGPWETLEIVPLGD